MYARYKHDFEIEKYLDFITEKKYKIALTQFRLSSHDLAIERGRYENLNRRESVCKLCNSNLVENECHLLLVCPFYRELRQKYFKPYYCRWPTLNKFDDMMSKTNKTAFLNVAKFVYHASNLRKLNIVKFASYNGSFAELLVNVFACPHYCIYVSSAISIVYMLHAENKNKKLNFMPSKENVNRWQNVSPACEPGIFITRNRQENYINSICF